MYFVVPWAAPLVRHRERAASIGLGHLLIFAASGGGLRYDTIGHRHVADALDELQDLAGMLLSGDCESGAVRGNAARLGRSVHGCA
jgi:hypothetical protein